MDGLRHFHQRANGSDRHRPDPDHTPDAGIQNASLKMTGEITGNLRREKASPTHKSPFPLAFNQLVEGSIPSPRTLLDVLFRLRETPPFAGSSYVNRALAVG